MKKIGMLVAVEIDAVLSRYGKPAGTVEYPGYTVWVYEADNYELDVVNCGPGEIAASAAVQFLISVRGVEMIVNFGVVGGLTRDMTISRTGVVEAVMHYDYETLAWNGGVVGKYPQFPDRYIETTPSLVEAAIAMEPSLKRLRCASADKFVDGAERKAALLELTGADICDMESAGVVITCRRNNVPCLLIKTVSDDLEGGAEAFDRQLQATSELCLSVADRLIRTL